MGTPLEPLLNDYKTALQWWRTLPPSQQLRCLSKYYPDWNLDMVVDYKPALVKIWKGEGNGQATTTRL